MSVLVQNSSVPVTIKIRLGYDKERIVAAEVAKIAEKNGVSAIAVHGRTRDEFFSGDIHFDEINLTITNIPAEKVDNAAELKQPFVQGSSERGTQGSGLGLAIAENNLAMLGYRLDV